MELKGIIMEKALLFGSTIIGFATLTGGYALVGKIRKTIEEHKAEKAEEAKDEA